MRKLQVFFFIITIFLNALFYATLTFLGGNYNEIIKTNFWLGVKLIFFIIIIIIFVKDFISSKTPLKATSAIYVLILLIVTTLASQILSFNFIHPLLLQDILIFGSRGIPVLLVGILISKRKEIKRVVSYTQVITIYISLAVLISFFSSNYRLGNSTSFGGANYQSAAYISALIFGLNLYYVFIHEKKDDLLPFFRTKFMTIVHLILSIILLLNTFQTGGRGGVVTCFVYIIVTFIYLIKNNKYFKIFISIFTIVIFYIVIGEYLDNPEFVAGFDRALSFLGGSSGFISLENSNRDTVFLNALEYIYNSPVYGYGLGTYYQIMGNYPHNLFLLILFEGGILLLIIFLLICFFIIRQLIKLIKFDKNNIIVIYIVLCNFTLLMFSGTYLRDDITWLLYGIIIGSFYHDSQKKKSNKIVESNGSTN